MNDCLFCKIVAGEIPNYTVYEDDTHLAFLTPYPNTKGFTVVIPKEHQPSYVFEVDQEIVDALMAANRKVAAKLESAMSDIARVGVIFEGYGVDHLHAKLFPMHGTKRGDWEEHASDIKTYFDQYQGYISSHNGIEADKEELAELAQEIRRAG